MSTRTTQRRSLVKFSMCITITLLFLLLIYSPGVYINKHVQIMKFDKLMIKYCCIYQLVSKQKIDIQKRLSPRNLRSKQSFAQKKFASKKIWPKIMLGPKNFWGKKLLVQNILGKIILRSNKKCHENFIVEKFWV